MNPIRTKDIKKLILRAAEKTSSIFQTPLTVFRDKSRKYTVPTACQKLSEGVAESAPDAPNLSISYQQKLSTDERSNFLFFVHVHVEIFSG